MMAETETKKQEPAQMVQVPIINVTELCLGDGVSVKVASNTEPLQTVASTAHSLMLNISRRVPTNSNEYTEHR